jgi:hypothetical protein
MKTLSAAIAVNPRRAPMILAPITLTIMAGLMSYPIMATAGTTISGTITIDGASAVAPISARELGINLGSWGADVTKPETLANLRKTGAKLIRWPGGTSADTYHWRDNATCNVRHYTTTPWTYVSSGAGKAWLPQNSFAHVVHDVAMRGNDEIAITVDFGTNPACTGPGDPAEAAAWVADVKAHGYNAHYWTVGNEQYGGWSPDLHVYAPASKYGGTGGHWGSVYTAAMNGPSGFYQQMKAQDATAMIGVDIEGGGLNDWDGWDAALLGCASVSGPTSCATTATGASFDFVELHWYAQSPGQESDSYLLNRAPQDFTGIIKQLRGELTATGHPASTPIMLGEFNSVAYAQGKQTMSIVNALFIGMMYGEILNDNLAVASMWFGTGGGQGCGNNNATSLYGWQNFGGYDAVADNTAYNWNNCTNNTTGPFVPEGTVFPAGRAANLVSQFATPGEHMLSTGVTAGLRHVRAYAATQKGGYALMLFNLDRNHPARVKLDLSKIAKTSFAGSTLTYGKAQYDYSQKNIWRGPVAASLGTVGAGLTLTLPVWSMTVVMLR